MHGVTGLYGRTSHPPMYSILAATTRANDTLTFLNRFPAD